MTPPVVEQILQSALSEKRKALLELEAKEICRAYEIPTPDFKLARTASEAAEAAVTFTFPVMLNVVSLDILHKSEAGRVLPDMKRGGDSAEEAIVRILRTTSRIMLENSCVEQMDLNPIMVYGSGASMGDPRVILNDNSWFNYQKM